MFIKEYYFLLNQLKTAHNLLAKKNHRDQHANN